MGRVKRWTVSGVIALSGVVVGALGTAYGYQRYVVRASSDAASQQAGTTADVLSELRLGNREGAIRFLEQQLDGNLAGVRSWEQNAGSPPSAAAIRWLSLAKVYRTAYASPTGDTDIAQFLNEIPMPAPTTDCQWGVCRLHKAGLGRAASTQPGDRKN